MSQDRSLYIIERCFYVSCDTRGWVMSHQINTSCHANRWVMSHTWMSLAAQSECVMSLKWVSLVTHMDESCRTRWMNESCRTKWMRHVTHTHKWMSHVTHIDLRVMSHKINASCHANGRVMSHMWMGVSWTEVSSKISLICMSHVTLLKYLSYAWIQFMRHPSTCVNS